MDWKLAAAILSAIFILAAYYPYLRDMFRGATKPHAYTWLVWLLTQGTATVAVWRGGGAWGIVGIGASTLLVAVVFVLSLRYGTRDITRSDTFALFAAIVAIVVWWQLANPVAAVLMVSAIDAIGYIPTYRKSYKDPWSETLSFWVAQFVGNALAIVALSSYNLLTVTYLATLFTANVVLFSLCFARRPFVSKARA